MSTAGLEFDPEGNEVKSYWYNNAMHWGSLSEYEQGATLGFYAGFESQVVAGMVVPEAVGATFNAFSQSRWLFDIGHKTLRPWNVIGTNRYLSGFQIGDFRFQFHKHPILGSSRSVKLPHINIGLGGRWHIMLSKPGARQAGGWIYRGAKGS